MEIERLFIFGKYTVTLSAIYCRESYLPFDFCKLWWIFPALVITFIGGFKFCYQFKNAKYTHKIKKCQKYKMNKKKKMNWKVKKSWSPYVAAPSNSMASNLLKLSTDYLSFIPVIVLWKLKVNVKIIRTTSSSANSITFKFISNLLKLSTDYLSFIPVIIREVVNKKRIFYCQADRKQVFKKKNCFDPLWAVWK